MHWHTRKFLLCLIPRLHTTNRSFFSCVTGRERYVVNQSACPSPSPRFDCCWCVALQANVDAGEILDEASVTSSSPRPSSSEANASTSCTCDLPRQPEITIVKDATSVTTTSGLNASATDVGDAIAYRITVSNTGNTWLSDVDISDPMFDELACSATYKGEDSRFASGDSIKCTALLTLNQAHIDNGCVENSASVSAGWFLRGSASLNIASSGVGSYGKV